MLRETPLYAILSGFTFGDTPGMGTFYDFFSRIWPDDSYHFPKMKSHKGKKKGDKTPCNSSSTALKLLLLLERWQFKPKNPFYLIFRLYKQQFLDLSIRKGLIHSNHLALAGDGHLSLLPHSSGKSATLTARRKYALPVTANGTILSPTATRAGTPTGNAISSVTTSTCTQLPIPIVFFLYSRFWNGLLDMTCFPFFIRFSP